jgi:hypothetical protein
MILMVTCHDEFSEEELLINFNHVSMVSRAQDGSAIIHFSSGKDYAVKQPFSVIYKDLCDFRDKGVPNVFI